MSKTREQRASDTLDERFDAASKALKMDTIEGGLCAALAIVRESDSTDIAEERIVEAIVKRQHNRRLAHARTMGGVRRITCPAERVDELHEKLKAADIRAIALQSFPVRGFVEVTVERQQDLDRLERLVAEFKGGA